MVGLFLFHTTLSDASQLYTGIVSSLNNALRRKINLYPAMQNRQFIVGQARCKFYTSEMFM